MFCDFDGTFAVQDVGRSIVERYLRGRRSPLWERLARGELSPWQYNIELLDGLELPRRELETLLRGVELDPGARGLLRWCEDGGIPFRVLSDGFDWNLERLQQLLGVRFAYDANQLVYEGEVWRIRAGHPDPACHCGNGTCKRGRIAIYRREHPGVPVVHVGNGRVSDLCAALSVDLVFAKETLATALEERGVSYCAFETLRDVQRELDARFGRQIAASGP